MDGVENFAVDDSEEFAVSKKGSPSDDHKECMIKVDILPFLGVFIVEDRLEGQLKVDNIQGGDHDDGDYCDCAGEVVVDVWLHYILEEEGEKVDPGYQLKPSTQGAHHSLKGS